MSETRSENLQRLSHLAAADRATQLALAARSHLLTERLARKTQDGTLGQRTAEPEDEDLAAMEVRVGDETHYHPAPAASGGLPGWAKLCLAALLGAGGLKGLDVAMELGRAVPGKRPHAPAAARPAHGHQYLELSTGELEPPK